MTDEKDKTVWEVCFVRLGFDPLVVVVLAESKDLAIIVAKDKAAIGADVTQVLVRPFRGTGN